ncbi:MAG: cation:proton antiporter [Alphaproteobacteria bacterium]|nr:cation:proton antiporter [Alphaproteobacteria bacterium]
MHDTIAASENLLSNTLLQLIVMIAAARLGNLAMRRLGQPGVVGEIVAGLLLGPSLLGSVFPGLSNAVFGAHPSAPIIVLSQIGLVLLMFQIGMDFEFSHLACRRNRNAGVAIAAMSAAIPFLLGMLFGRMSAPFLAPDMDVLGYSLFLGAGLAITAMPILGRILQEFGLARSELGVVAITAAAINDVAGWVLLAAISAYAAARLSVAGLVWQVAGLCALLGGMWFVARRLVSRLLAVYPVRDGMLPPNLMMAALCLAFIAGLCTGALGIFTIFGGFLTGLLFHHDRAFVEAWRRQVGRFVLIFFLPVFFTFTGLRTNIWGLDSVSDCAWMALLLAAAVLGKMIPVYATGRLAGFDSRESSILGVLMNTRALMELIVLNIGFDMGVIPLKVFTMLVIMAVVTTVMAGPLLRVLLRRMGHAIPQGVEA